MQAGRLPSLPDHPELHQPPPLLPQPVPQQEALLADVLGARHPVAALQLDVASARLDLPGRPDQHLHLLALDHEVRQEGRRLLRPQGNRRIGPGELHQEPGALGDQGLGIVSAPGPARLLRRPGQLRLLGGQAGRRQRDSIALKPVGFFIGRSRRVRVKRVEAGSKRTKPSSA